MLPGRTDVRLNEFQIWILVQMGVEDARFPPYSSGHWSITPKQIARTVPRNILPKINSMEYIWTSLIQLKDHNFIDWNPHNFEFDLMGRLEYTDTPSHRDINPHDKTTERYWKHDDMNFHITGDGVLVFRKYLGPLSDVLNTETYDTIIEKTEGPKEVKTAYCKTDSKYFFHMGKLNYCNVKLSFFFDVLSFLYLFFKFSLFQGYSIYRFTFLTLCTKVSYIPKCVGSKIIQLTAILT